MSKKIEQAVAQVVEPIINGFDMELVAVEYRTRDDVVNITVYIYKKGGVSLDDCEKVHNAIDIPLDELDPTKNIPYVLNVSSPGLDRAFKTDADFARNIGEKVEMKFFAQFDGKKMLKGVLKDFTDSNITIEVDGKNVMVRREKIAKINLAIEFN